MATPFIPEEFQQQVNEAVPQSPQPQYQGASQGYAAQAAMPQQTAPQAPVQQPYAPQYHAPQAQVPQPEPYQPPGYNSQPYNSQAPQEWTPSAPQNYQPPQVAQGHYYNTPPMPPAQPFMPPPSSTDEASNIMPEKLSRFSLKRLKKEKLSKEVQEKPDKVKAEKTDAEYKTKTSPPIIFMFGMAAGILAFLLGNMAMAGLFADKTAQNFSEIERRNAAVAQPVLPSEQQTAELSETE